MKTLPLLAATAIGGWAAAHPMMGAITWNRHVSRIVYARCVSCHREGGTAFSLMEYPEARERADAIKQAVLARTMPPWGAVKGFGDLRDDQGLSEAQIEMIVDWVDTGMGRGNNPRTLPERPAAPAAREAFVPPSSALPVRGEVVLDRAITVAGLFPRGSVESARIFAVRPDGEVEPLVWLYEYRSEYAHPFWLAKAVQLPRGTTIRGVPQDAEVLLIPAS